MCHRFKYINTYAYWFFFICIKGKLVLLLLRHLLLDKTGNVSQETRPKLIGSQNFYFHLFYKLFCSKVMHSSENLSLICPRFWPIENVCIGLYVLKSLLNVRPNLEKGMSMQHSFEEFLEKERIVELKSVGNFVAKTVLVENENQFSMKELCRTQYNLKYFSTPYHKSDMENP